MSRGQFLHGVASGDPTSDGIVLWTRVTPDSDAPAAGIRTRWVVRDASSGGEVAGGEAVAVPDNDWTLRVISDGLAPDTAHEYEFAIGDVVSPTGRFRTLPTEASRLDFGVFACTKREAPLRYANRSI